MGVPLRVALYLALAASAIVTLAGLPALQEWVERGQLRPWWLLAPAVCFGIFLLMYVADRLWLLRHRRYPSGRALYQIALGIVFLLLLLPSSIREYRTVVQARRSSDVLVELFGHRDARVRALACELASRRETPGRYLPQLQSALQDGNLNVRVAAQEAVARALASRPQDALGEGGSAGAGAEENREP